MPNDCFNYLQAPDGDMSLIEEYIVTKKIYDNGLPPDLILDFEKIIPYPQCIKDTIHLWDYKLVEKMSLEEHAELVAPAIERNLKECGYRTFHEWRTDNWGTKWNSYEADTSIDGVSFSTAWSPPVPVIVELSKKIGKPLCMIYDEPGIDFCGEVLANPDGTYDDNCYSPRTDAPEHLKEKLMINEEEELDESWKIV
jgi:hypothetical protein